MVDTESSTSGGLNFARTPSRFIREKKQKIDKYNEVLHRLKDLDFEESNLPAFEDELWAHFDRLPARYAVDVKAERAHDVLMHKRLLNMARDPVIRHAIEVRLVEVNSASGGNCSYSWHSNFKKEVDDAQCSDYPSKRRVHPPPAFGLAPDVELSLEVNNLHVQERHDGVNSNPLSSRAMHEVTISTYDKPKIFSQLSSLLSEIGLNIQEAHAFSTIDGYSLDVFVVKGWALEETEELSNRLVKKMQTIEKDPSLTCHSIPASGKQDQTQIKFISNYYMSGGSMYDFLHKQKGVFTLPSLIRVATDVSKGMNYLHHNNIIHRDLKAANLLINGNGEYFLPPMEFHTVMDYSLITVMAVKVADFGIARMQAQSGVMTAETGTYRWMAPEVIEHKPYDHKVDVFSFGILLWEMLTGKLPYEQLTPLQAAVGVVQKGLRPTIPRHTSPKLVELLERCWQQDPSLRPEFSEIVQILQHMANRVADERMDRQKGKII
uniref:Protein kinase domain-containing protein n=1 Tax=Fagus sylvatica TaxID=28930 RepID=A0A2N9FAY4_FAGSY